MAKNNVAIKKAQAQKASRAGSSHESNISLAPKPIISTIHELKQALNTTINDYFSTLTPKLKLIDIFLVFLVALGVLQFIYVLLIGNFPFNAFLGGFAICVGQFVLLVSLRLQINDGQTKKETTEEEIDIVIDNKGEIEEIDVVEAKIVEKERIFESITPERAFADFLFASLILHFIVIHFIN
ncbi:OST2 [Candida oxycetoniae]|uniref:Dolichyl-diphosphooligosaccharide--protein glycosyltransferase subunit OST2 n=1 Tax=Candida oxycetoniae TaxID=497107 RepID=A0AAI9SXD1_9ASCO|nr:OST2 [Candida oxycetoniae]KAI3404481.1 OST2 [Candida oxycetoniae]